jgi:hypothetical protein
MSKACRCSAPLTRTKREKDSNAHMEVALQPWFLPRSISSTVFHLLPREYRLKMHDYFLAYGCLRCERRNAFYCSNGMCQRCCIKVNRRLGCCIRRRLRESARMRAATPPEDFFAAAKVARKLLRDLTPATRNDRRPRKYTGSTNPANTFFGPINRG